MIAVLSFTLAVACSCPCHPRLAPRRRRRLLRRLRRRRCRFCRRCRRRVSSAAPLPQLPQSAAVGSSACPDACWHAAAPATSRTSPSRRASLRLLLPVRSRCQKGRDLLRDPPKETHHSSPDRRLASIYTLFIRPLAVCASFPPSLCDGCAGLMKRLDRPLWPPERLPGQWVQHGRWPQRARSRRCRFGRQSRRWRSRTRPFGHLRRPSAAAAEQQQEQQQGRRWAHKGPLAA